MRTLCRLGEIAEIFNGKTPAKTEQRPSGHRVLKIRDVDAHGSFRGKCESFVEPELAAKHRSKWLQVGDSLILNAAHNSSYVASKTYLVSEVVAGALPTGEWLVVRARSERVMPLYLHFWLQSSAARRVIGAAVKGIHLYPRDVALLETPLISLADQAKVVDLLLRAHSIVQMRRDACAKVAELRMALFHSMFGDPVMNENGWPTAQLAELVRSIDSGRSPRCLGRPAEDGEWAVLKLGAVTYGTYDESENKALPDSVVANPAVEVRAGDVLLSRKNTYDLVGASTYVWHTYGKKLLPDLIFRLNIMDDAMLNPVFLWALLSAASTRASLRKLASGSAGSMPNISKERLRTLQIVLPPEKLQAQFARRAEACRSIEIQQSVAAKKAESMMNSMLDRTFS